MVNWWPWTNSGVSVKIFNNGNNGQMGCGGCGQPWMSPFMRSLFCFQIANNFLSQTAANIGNILRRDGAGGASSSQPVPFNQFYAPQQQQGFFPYVNFSNNGAQGYPMMGYGQFGQYGFNSDGRGAASQMRNLQTFAESYKDKCTIAPLYDDSGNIKSYLITGKDGNRTTFEGSVEELGNKLAELYPAKAKTAERTEEEDDEETTVRSSRAGDDDDTAVRSSRASDADDAKRVSADEEGASAKKKVRVPNGWAKEGNNFWDKKIGDSDITMADLIARDAGKNTHDCAAAIVSSLIKYDNLESNFFTTDKQENYNQLIKDIIQYNPSIFNDNGSIKDGVTAETIKQKLDLPSKETLISKYKANETSTTGGTFTENIQYNGTKYSYGLKYSSGNMIYKNQEGSWSDWDRDAVIVIDNKAFKIKRNDKGDEVDFGDLTSTSSNFTANSKLCRIMTSDSDGKCRFKSSWPNNNDKFYMYDLEGNKTNAYICNIQNKSVLMIGDKTYNMNDVMDGKVHPEIQ